MFFIPAVFILALFYSIYFIKQIAAGRKGIQTRQLGKGKIGQNHGAYSFHGNFFRCTGAIGFSFFRLEFYADACKNSRYCGRNSRRFDFSCGGAHYEKQLEGRNPAFLGFDLMYMGILLMYFNWLLVLFTVWACVMLHIQMSAARTY